MEDERKQKGGKKLEKNTAIDIPEDIYLEYYTHDEQETMPKRKIRLQKIERRWAKEWKEYRFVTPKYAKKFALKPPGKQPLDYPQDAHPSSLKTIDDYPEEKSKHLSKLQKQAEATVRKFNEESAAAATAATSSVAKTSGTAIPQMKYVPSKPKASKPQEKMPQKAAPASAPKPSAPPKASKPELQQIVKQVPTLSDRQSLKNNFIKFSTNALDDYKKKAAPPATTQHAKIEEPQTAPAEEIPQESHADELAIEEITKETLADASKPANDSVPAEETASAEETARTDVSPPLEEKTSSQKSSKVKKMTPSASDVEKTRAAEKEAKKRKTSSTEESTEAKRLKSLDENAPLDPGPLNIAPSYEMTPFESEDKEHLTDEEMKNAASKEHTDEEIQIDDSPHTSIHPEEPAQGLAEPADEFGSSTKQTPQAEENQGENPQPKENPNPEQNPQPEARDEEIPPPEQNPQPEAHVDDIPQPEQDPQPEAQSDEIPHPEEHAEENAPAPYPENALVIINPETAMIVSPQGKKQNLQPMQRQPFSKRPKFWKESFFEERMYFIRENPYDNPRIRHVKFWTRTQLNYYASVLCGRNKIFQHMHIPHVEFE
ncbi:hypothetical protein ZWY2020_029576 [Hordeum vulgare]|nr:hypothetical protein ZWY2020_029576 [Hordeum vulgare]